MSNSLQKYNNRNAKWLTKQLDHGSHHNFYETDNNTFAPRKIISLLLNYKWIVLLFILVGAAGAWFYADSVTPVYESSGTLIITSGGNTGTNDDISRTISQATGYETSTTLKNELQVLRSRSFSEQVAQQLLKNKPDNIKKYPIYWRETENEKLVRTSKGDIASRVSHNINFYQPDDEAQVINVNYKSAYPKEAAKVVNVAMHNYMDQSKKKNRQAATSTADFLKGEKKKLENRLHSAEQDLQNYMDATGIVQVDQQATNIVNQRGNTAVKLQDVTTELKAVEENISDYKKQLKSVSRELTDQLTEAVGPRIRAAQRKLAQFKQERSSIISNNPGVLKRDTLPPRLQYLKKQIGNLEQKITKLSQKLYTKDNKFAGMNSADHAQRVSELQTKLSDQQTKLKQLKTEKQALTQKKNRTEAKFNKLPQGMVKLAKLKRDVKINEQLYLNVSKKYADISLLEQSKFGFGRIVDSASEPGGPVSPNKKIFLILGVMLGGFLAASFIVIREFSDNSVNNVSTLKTTHLPPLSVVPNIEKSSNKGIQSFEIGEGTIPDEMVMLNNRSGIPAEAIRRLKNNITFQNGETPPGSIVVTSPEKGDGKSTLSANLAMAFAEEGYWTLLIDADFRRSKLQDYFGINDKQGLSNYLNDEIPFDRLLKETDLETLKLITGGEKAEMPEVLSSKRKFRQLLKKMEDAFDVIIMDTPPYGVISDSSALIKYAEATVLVAQYRKTNKGMLFKTIEELNQIQANISNIVLNNFDHRNEVSNYYGDGYYQAIYSNYEEYL